MRIVAVDTGGLGERLGLRPGDELLSLNGHALSDELDVRFWSSEGVRWVEVEREGKRHTLRHHGEPAEELGVQLEPMRFRTCGNACLFCFVDQNPRGMRPSLYVKDEDYRLSFLHGNYVTLSNAGWNDLLRIAELRLSPLYISVHTTDSELRKKLLGLRRDDRLLEKIAFLAGAGITMHAQVVICPGYNDGASLEQTIDTLLEFFPQVASVALVPVGLTRHRQKLTPLRPVDARLAKEIVGRYEQRAHELRNLFGSYFVYLADELYLGADHEIPPAGRYEDFPQVENGVGMVRKFLDQFRKDARRLPRSLSQPTHVTVITGMLAAPIVQGVCAHIARTVANLKLEVVPVPNRFYGDTVTVSGLLTGQDVWSALRDRHCGDIVILPGNCLNSDGYFLDDWTPTQLSRMVGVPVEIVDPGRIAGMFENHLLGERVV
jgi:putative radical SAM enzyme (TIGR03279 family)